ncbi:MAG: hypothetical protein FI687_02690 [SAR202 cluster bacterium]|nr:hypothetical protein [SAR202 cluster bacterium]|tara:strand:- start:60892 stop:61203 length:312 start_codon:yes stop_codon:yes gene_type:complete
MPSKSKKIAARQANLRNKRKKENKTHNLTATQINSTFTENNQVTIEPSNEIESHVPKNTIKTDQQNLANNNTVTSSINLKSELIRIGISASIIFLILIGYSLI